MGTLDILGQPHIPHYLKSKVIESLRSRMTEGERRAEDLEVKERLLCRFAQDCLEGKQTETPEMLGDYRTKLEEDSKARGLYDYLFDNFVKPTMARRVAAGTLVSKMWIAAFQVIEDIDRAGEVRVRFNWEVRGEVRLFSEKRQLSPDSEIRVMWVLPLLERVRGGIEGELDISKIRQPFNEWLREYEESWSHRCSPDLAGTISRSGANVLKLTMMFQADQAPSITLSPEAFERARKTVEFANDQTARLLAEGLGLSPDARQRRRIAAMIERAGMIEHSTLLKNSHIDSKHLKRHIETLLEAQEVVIVNQEGDGCRSRKAYRWLDGATP